MSVEISVETLTARRSLFAHKNLSHLATDEVASLIHGGASSREPGPGLALPAPHSPAHHYLQGAAKLKPQLQEAERDAPFAGGKGTDNTSAVRRRNRIRCDPTR